MATGNEQGPQGIPPGMQRGEMPPEIKAELEALKLAYYRCFNSVDGKIVLEDLKKAAFFDRSIMSDTDRKTFRNEGCREMVLRILMIIKQFKPEGETQ